MKPDINEVQKFWNNRPCNIRHSKKEIGTLEYFEEVEKKRYRVEPHILQFGDFENSNGKKVLEIGCGIGTDTIMFAKNGAEVTAIDLSEKSIELCKKRFEIYNLKSTLVQGDAEKLSEIIPIQKFDIIYSFGVIHHTPNPQKIIEQLKLYCHENTLIKLMFYSKISWKGLSFYLKYGWKFNFNYKDTIKFFAEAQLDSPIAEVYSLKDLKNMFKDFNIVKIEKNHIFSYKIKDYIEGKLNKTLIFKFMPRSIFNWLKSKLGWHYLITLKYNKSHE